MLAFLIFTRSGLEGSEGVEMEVIVEEKGKDRLRSEGSHTELVSAGQFSSKTMRTIHSEPRPSRMKSILSQRQTEAMTMELLKNGERRFGHFQLRKLCDYILAVIQRIYQHNAKSEEGRMGGKGQEMGKGETGDGESGNTGFSTESLNIHSKILGKVIRRRRNREQNDADARAEFKARQKMLRDLRRLEFSFAPQGEDPFFAVRKHAILFALDPLRGVILHDRILVIVPEGADGDLGILDRNMRMRENNSMSLENDDGGLGVECSDDEDENTFYGEDDSPFELLALEGVLSSVLEILERDVNATIDRVQDCLYSMGAHQANKLSAEGQEKLRFLKDTVMTMNTRLRSYRRLLLEILDDDQDMALCNLSTFAKNPILCELPLKVEIQEDHEEVEMLFEVYLQNINSQVTKLDILDIEMTNMQDLVQLSLDTARNKLLTVSTIFSLVSMCLGLSAMVGSLFGMNLRNGHEDDSSAFIAVSVSLACVSLVTCLSLGALLVYTGVLVK